MPEQSIFSRTQFSLQTQTERLALSKANASIRIGIPKETGFNEKRIALVPQSVLNLVARGHEIVIEKGAGLSSNFSDHEFAEAGARIASDKETVYSSHVILKVAPPSEEELSYFRPNQILISPLHLPGMTPEFIQTLRQKRVTAIAMEYLQAEDGTFPIVRIMSEIAGLAVIHTGAELLSDPTRGKGVLLGGISGVPPARVVILGAGVVAEYATRAALALGAEVRIFDDKIHRLIRIQNRLGKQIFTSSMNPVILTHELCNADLAIGAIHSKTGRTTMVVSEEMVMKMRPGSVIIDVSIDQGGCFETSQMTSHEKPTRVIHGIVHYCVPNIPSKVSRTASIGISNILTSILQEAGDTGGIEPLIYNHKGLRNGIYTFKGCLTNEYLANRFQIKYTQLDLLITSII
ncbi:MAG TPA: alanine dehydrogenase [Saprospiraceae bacterium]|jgi:alanine dehydrogenase|nr:alanine dehydrogenase [Saprospiraceae bacterium]HMS29252.1 alanine dehydrogenase [Saprospiraceae bacterium]